MATKSKSTKNSGKVTANEFELDTSALDHTYVIYGPSGTHKHHRLVKINRVTQKTETVKVPEIQHIAEMFLDGKIDDDEARKLLSDLRFKLYEKDGATITKIVFNTENRKLLEKYWKDEYEYRLGRLVDSKTTWYDLSRAVDAVGKVSLITGTRSEIQKQIDKVAKGNKHRRIVFKLNQLLKYLGRDIELLPAHKVPYEVRHIALEELPLVLNKIPDPKSRIMVEAAFRTGCRLGELFALDLRTYSSNRNVIKVAKQLDLNGVRRQTKNRKERTAYVLPGSAPVLEAWVAVRDQVTNAERITAAATVKKACALAFPKDKSKWLTFHDLRHCYVIHLLSNGVPLDHVAQSIGDSISVAQEHYAGFNLSPTSLDLINKILAG
jgi:integrase